MAKAKAAGSFFGGLFGNPVVALLLLGLGALLIFRKDITNFLDKGIGNITLPDITLPDITLPDITLPDFSGIFEGFQQQQTNFFKQFTDLFTGGGIPQPQKMVEDTGLDPLASCQCGASIVQDAFGNVNVTCKQCDAVDTSLPSQDPSLNVPMQEGFVGGIGGGLLDFLGLTPAQKFVQEKISGGNLPQGFQQFQTEGSIGNLGFSINPVPIQNLSLSQIIDMFDVTASQAANILAIAKDDFGNFDFGTNTGGGIGSIIPSISEFIGGSDVNVSSSQFEGLSAQEIANILTGGNIQNF